MGILKPVNIAIVMLSIAASVMTLRFYSAAASDRAANYAAQEVGPWKLSALMIAGVGDSSDPIRASRFALVLVRFCPDCWGEIKRLWINVGPAPLGAKGMRVSGQPGFARAGVKLPDKLDADTRLWMAAEDWGGRVHQGSWSLVPRK